MDNFANTKKAVVCGNDDFRSIFRNAHHFLEWQPGRSRSEQIQQADLLIVQQKPKREYLSGFTNGYAFIQDLRVDASCQLPIILTTASFPDDEKSVLPDVIAQDPFVHIMPETEIASVSQPKDFLRFFDHDLNQKELDALFLDMRLTLYQNVGYINELRHQMMGLLERLDDWHTPPGWKGAYELWRKSRRVVSKWLPKEELATLAVPVSESDPPELNPMAFWPLARDWYDELYNQLRGKLERPAVTTRQIPTAELLYISDDPTHQQLLGDGLKTIAQDFPIVCHTAHSVQSALERCRGRTYDKPLTVVTDFRFRQEGGKRAFRNGFAIIDRIRSDFPNFQYLLLSNFPVQYYEALLPKYPVQFFSKGEVLHHHSVTIRKLASVVIAHQNQRMDRWPEALNSKEDKKWSDLYQKFLQQPDFRQREQALSEKAHAIVREVLNGQSVESYWARSLQRPITRLIEDRCAKIADDAQKTRIQLDILEERLLFRRACLGLLAERALGRMNVATNNHVFERLYLALCEGGQPTSGTLSRILNCCRILPSKSYDQHSRYITRHEADWLAYYL